ncbi:MAG: dihydrodipicolinate synthase family protein [Bacteroidales bacterium]|nr:dihydrodipicolinate synthase family protein [Bacteroidales bacterium]
MTVNRIEGLVAAPFTPMDKNGNLNPDLIDTYYEFLEKNGIAGAFINGSTGEGASLTQKEKQIQTGRWAKCRKSRGTLRIINLVGGTSYRECIENALFSYEAGVSAIAILAPYYYKPADENQLAEFCALIGESVPQLPVYFYHIPVLTGVNIPMIGFMEKISSILPNFAGIKYTHEDLMDFSLCLSFRDGAYNILWGSDECLLSSLVLGCRGAVGSTYNYAAPLYHNLIEAFMNGNLEEAGRLQRLSVDMIRILGKYGGLATGKAFMRLVGIDCGNFRSPVKNMPDSMFNTFTEDVKSLGIDHLLSKM